MHRLTEVSLRWPRLTLLLAVALGAFGLWSFLRTPLSAGADAYIGADHPALHELERFVDAFGGGYPVIIAWSCGETGDPCASVFDENSLRMASAVGGAIGQSASISRVTSLANTPLLVGTPDGILSHRFVADGRVSAPPAFALRALADPLWVGALVAKGGDVAALIAEARSTTPADQFAAIDAIESALAPFEAQGFHFRLSGGAWIEVALMRAARADAQVVAGLTGLIVAVSVFLFIRSWQSIASVLVSIAIASLGCCVLLPLAGWSCDPMIAVAPTLVLVMGTADAIHYLTSYWDQRLTGITKDAALRAAARETSSPCVMTTLTAAAGMLSFLGSGSPALVHFSAVAAVGVALCLLLTFSALPALMHLLPDSTRYALIETERWDRTLRRVMLIPARNPGGVLLASALVTVVCAAGLTKLEANSSLLLAFKSKDPMRTAVEYVATRLRPLEGVELALTAPEPLVAPSTFRELELLEQRLASEQLGGSIRSIRVHLAALASSMGYARLDEQNVGELLGLAEMADRSALDPWISLDGRQLRLSIDSKETSQKARKAYMARVDRALAKLPSDWGVVITGPSALHLAIDAEIERSAIASLSNSIVFVTLLVMAFLRSARWGLLAMIPNLVPLAILYGLLGWLGIPIDGGIAIVGPIAIGIAVDDTIHLLHAYTRERRLGVDSIAALERATRHCGRAIATTAVALALGFTAMGASRFQTATNIGRLSAIAIVAAAFAELLLLPALLVFASRVQLPSWLRRPTWNA